jgi:hypothetical protein
MRSFKTSFKDSFIIWSGLRRTFFLLGSRPFFCLDTKETKNASPVRPAASGQWPPDKKLKTTSQKRALAEPFALQAHF